MGAIAVESVIMFFSSMVVFLHIVLGGVVGVDIRRSICVRDLLFGALLSILVSFYMITKFFFLSSVERKNLYDTHLMHTIVNLILLENLLMNRSAMAYWRQISCRLMNNWPALRSPKVAASLINAKTGRHLGNEHSTELGKNSLIEEQKMQDTDIAAPANSFTVFEISMPENRSNEISMPENRSNKVKNMPENPIKEVDKNNLEQYRFNTTKESIQEFRINSGIFHKDEYISPSDTRIILQNENKENSAETALKLPKIIVVQPMQDPS